MFSLAAGSCHIKQVRTQLYFIYRSSQRPRLKKLTETSLKKYHLQILVKRKFALLYLCQAVSFQSKTALVPMKQFLILKKVKWHMKI